MLITLFYTKCVTIKYDNKYINKQRTNLFILLFDNAIMCSKIIEIEIMIYFISKSSVSYIIQYRI